MQFSDGICDGCNHHGKISEAQQSYGCIRVYASPVTQTARGRPCAQHLSVTPAEQQWQASRAQGLWRGNPNLKPHNASAHPDMTDITP
eukprot:scaffold224003_cov27-Prasinocladus_malaysianus.AAC.1